MTILALDTASDLASVAVRCKGQIASELSLQSTAGFGHLLFAAIRQALAEAKVALSEIDAISVSSGPGSFTGVRIGLSAAKGLSESMCKPLIAISNLKLLAGLKSSSFRKNEASFTAVAIDARRGEVYGAVYAQDGSVAQAETVLPFASWLDTLDPSTAYQFISPTPLALAGTPYAGMPFIQVHGPLAGTIAEFAEVELAAGRVNDTAGLDANYVRRSDAELFWKE